MTSPIAFRSVAHLSDRLRAWATDLPRDLELIVGIPRSGMIAATMLASYRNLPVATLEGFLDGRLIGHGSTRPVAGDAIDDFLQVPRRVLVLDDSTHSGGSLRAAREAVEASGLPHQVVYGAVYGRRDVVSPADLIAEFVDVPRLFEWNVLHHPQLLPRLAVDLDGVLCEEPPVSPIEEPEAYERFLADARMLRRPSGEVGWIVTSRLERQRAVTEAWLETNGIAYRELVMLDGVDEEARAGLQLHGPYKASMYRRTGADLFIESDVRQAIEIAELSGRPVLCTDVMRMFHPGSSRTDVHPPDAGVAGLAYELKRLLPSGLRRWLGEVRRGARALLTSGD